MILEKHREDGLFVLNDNENVQHSNWLPHSCWHYNKHSQPSADRKSAAHRPCAACPEAQQRNAPIKTMPGVETTFSGFGFPAAKCFHTVTVLDGGKANMNKSVQGWLKMDETIAMSDSYFHDRTGTNLCHTWVLSWGGIPSNLFLKFSTRFQWHK